MWNCPNCKRAQPFSRHLRSPGLIRKKWRCGYCNALLSSTLIAGPTIALLVATVWATLGAWLLSVELSPFSYVTTVPALMVFFVWLNHRLVVEEVDHVVCAHCGYDLHGNTTGACPECGETYSPAESHLHA